MLKIKVRYLRRERDGSNKECREINHVYKKIQPLVLLVQTPATGERWTKFISITTLSLQNAVEVGLNIFLICTVD